MLCTGIDIIEIDRVERAVHRWGERFLHRIYTPAELQLSRRPPALAARFAGKEAVMKALGTGNKGVGWREIEILAAPSGQPVVRLNGRAREKARTLKLRELAISLSHCKEYALASVAGDRE